MHNITDAASLACALDSPISRPIKALLRLRRDQLLADDPQPDIADFVHFVVVDDASTIAAIEAAAGYPVVTTRAFEWVADHGGLLEAATVLDDDGFALVLICPDDEAIDADLLAVLRELAEPADDLIAHRQDRDRATAA